ncbi:MAG: molybdopterin dinucleotide binding domain-containing protein, partial [Terriglobales bacterium]
FADVILPACTNFERWDIGEWAGCGGYGYQFPSQLNHRVVVMQHPCIKPLGESKPDFEIFRDLAIRLGLSAVFTEGSTQLDWCKRFFDGSDVSKYISWKKFLRKGYYVVPPEAETLRAATAYRWYYEGRKKDVPEPFPLPGDYTEKWLEGLQPQSGKIEFVPESLKNFGDPERPALNRYIPSWEGSTTGELLRSFPIQLLTPHVRYSFHSLGDGKDSTINDIPEHRRLIDGHYYLVVRISPADAKERAIKDGDLVRLFNDRGEVICAAEISNRLRQGVAHAYQASADYKPLGLPGKSPDRGGCVNLLTSSRSQSARASSMAPNSCLIQVERWSKALPAATEKVDARMTVTAA